MGEPPFPRSLCHGCRHLKSVAGKASTFLMCTALADRYPRQPVVQCETFEPKPEEKK